MFWTCRVPLLKDWVQLYDFGASMGTKNSILLTMFTCMLIQIFFILWNSYDTSVDTPDTQFDKLCIFSDIKAEKYRDPNVKEFSLVYEYLNTDFMNHVCVSAITCVCNFYTYRFLFNLFNQNLNVRKLLLSCKTFLQYVLLGCLAFFLFGKLDKYHTSISYVL
jgi:hypothetical protein